MCYPLSMTTINVLTANVDLKRTTHKFAGEFANPMEFTITPAVEPHVIGYWSLTVLEVETAETSAVYYTVRLASLRTENQCRSKFGEEYHSDDSHNRHSLTLVPKEILAAISEATGENLIEVYDSLVESKDSQ